MLSADAVALGLGAGLVVGAAAGAGVHAAVSRRAGQRPVRRPDPEPAARGPQAQDVLDALPLAVLVLDVQERVLVANRAARELGLDEDLSPQLRELVRDTRVHGRPHDAELSERFPRPGRPPAVHRARLAPLDDSRVAVLLEDTTEPHRLEAVRRDFVANVSHELKTPVGALGLLAEALQEAADDPVAVRRFASRANREAQRLAALVQDLVALSRLEGAEPLPEPDVVDLDRVVAEAADRVRTAAQARSITVIRGGDRGLRVQGSEHQLTTAVGNLLENAVHYSPDGARVVVAAQVVQREADRSIEITVTDEGIGIAPRDVERVFERFYRADPARSRATGGTGLGLAIVKHVMTNHGGTVAVRSTEGYGSTFTLRLPQSSQAGPAGRNHAPDPASIMIESPAATRPGPSRPGAPATEELRA